MSHISIGIDIGNTNSKISITKNGVTKILSGTSGFFYTPSCIKINNDKIIVGNDAKQSISYNSCDVIYDIKRLILQNYNNQKFQEEMDRYPFEIVDDNGKVAVKVKNKIYSLKELFSFIFKKLISNVSFHLNTDLTERKFAVITVPPYYNDEQIDIIKEAAKMAKIDILSIVDDATAALVAYGYNSDKLKSNSRVLVVDFGGSTLCVTILEVNNNVIIKKACEYDLYLGGEDVTDNLLQYFVFLLEEENVYISKNLKMLKELYSACDKGKCELSYSDEIIINDKLLLENNVDTIINEAKFNNINLELFIRVVEVIDITLKKNSYNRDDIYDIIMIGGSSSIQDVQSLLKDYFAGKDIINTIVPEEVVALGAGILADNMVKSGYVKKYENGSEVLMNKDTKSIICQLNDIKPPLTPRSPTRSPNRSPKHRLKF